MPSAALRSLVYVYTCKCTRAPAHPIKKNKEATSFLPSSLPSFLPSFLPSAKVEKNNDEKVDPQKVENKQC